MLKSMVRIFQNSLEAWHHGIAVERPDHVTEPLPVHRDFSVTVIDTKTYGRSSECSSDREPAQALRTGGHRCL